MELVTSETLRGFTLNIYYDECPESPRTWDNLGILYIPRPPRNCRNLSDSWVNKEDAQAAPVQIPVYCYDHGDIYIGESCPIDRWDSWRAGTYYITEEAIKKEYGAFTEETVKKAREVASAELETYSSYFSGDVYMYQIEDESGDVLDCCGGFIGDSDLDYIREIFQEFVNNRIAEESPLFVAAGINPVTLQAIA